MSKALRMVADYCIENIFNYEERVSMALEKIYYWRHPLHLVDESLYSEIVDAIEECATDYEMDVEDIDPEDIIRL